MCNTALGVRRSNRFGRLISKPFKLLYRTLYSHCVCAKHLLQMSTPTLPYISKNGAQTQTLLYASSTTKILWQNIPSQQTHEIFLHFYIFFGVFLFFVTLWILCRHAQYNRAGFFLLIHNVFLVFVVGLGLFLFPFIYFFFIFRISFSVFTGKWAGKWQRKYWEQT